jgi:hypothetical protein
MQAAHGCRGEGDRAGTLDAVRAVHMASRFAVRCLRLANELQPPPFPSLYVRLRISAAVSRLIRRHGTAQAALLALQGRLHVLAANGHMLRGPREASRDAYWRSVAVSLARRADEAYPPLHVLLARAKAVRP